MMSSTEVWCVVGVMSWRDDGSDVGVMSCRELE